MPYNPKTSWTPQDAPGPSDFNRIEQGIADATAVAETAQQTAATAQQTANSASTAITNHINAVSAAHPASAISNTPAGNISATTVQAAINELDSEKAGKNQVNTWTQRQTFAAGIQDGDNNADVSDIYSLRVPLDTRSVAVTQWDSTHTSEPKQIQIKDGAAVMATIDVLARNSDGKPTSIRITQGARVRTWTITWTSGRNWPDSISKA